MLHDAHPADHFPSANSSGRSTPRAALSHCLVEAANSNPDDEHWLDMLLQQPATEVVGIEPEFWKILAAIRNTVGRVDAASAALMALDYDIDVATRTPGLYAGLGGGEIALPLED